METDKFKILNNFLNEKENLVESEFSESFEVLRKAYVEELAQPGCTQCIRNACRSKYTQRLMGILNGEIDRNAPPPAQRPAPVNKDNSVVRRAPPDVAPPEVKS